jgi:hypothetical protein
MKSTTSALSAPFVLKVVGYVLLLFALTDYVILLSPMKWSDSDWFANFLSQFVDRGTTPLIGIAMVYVSSFLDSGSLRAEGRSPFGTGRFFVMLLSGILGLLFLVTVPLQYVKTGESVQRVTEQFNKQEKAVEDQVQQRLTDLREQVKDKGKLDLELKQVDQIIATGQANGQPVNPNQMEFIKKSQKDLQKLKEDPKHLEVMAKEASAPELQKIREAKQKAEEQVRPQANRAIIKTGLSSLLLSIAFSLISWLGLAEMGIFSKR